MSERWLGAWARRVYGSDFLYVTGYPAVKRPFYTHPEPANLTFTNSFGTTYGQIARGGTANALYLGFNLGRKFY